MLTASMSGPGQNPLQTIPQRGTENRGEGAFFVRCDSGLARARLMAIELHDWMIPGVNRL